MGARRILDVDFIAEHTHGFEDFADFCRRQDRGPLEQTSGLDRTPAVCAGGVTSPDQVNAGRAPCD
jgi:hypothetical protein